MQKLDYAQDSDLAVGHFEAHIAASEGHAVDTVGRVVVVGSGVEGEHVGKGLSLVGGEHCGGLAAECHLQWLPLSCVGEAAGSLGVGVGVWHVWLHVVDGCAVHEVCAAHGDVAVGPYAHYADRGEAKAVGAEGRPRGEDAHALVASKAGRAHGEALRVGRCLGAAVVGTLGSTEPPYQPHIVKALKAANGLGMAVAVGKLYAPRQAADEAALSRNAELRGERRAEKSYWFDCHGAKIAKNIQ